ncbi:trypsin-like peptidase domain-containing protein [Candidatus Pacearchaeota archaeon]|nr:trypsin-like peptidase domain-containing protein [Candidatus Pacearchaeota archaeon]
MALKTHHKWLIGGFSSFVVIFMIASGTFTYIIFVKQEINYNLLNQKLNEIQADTQVKINDLVESVSETNEFINTELGSISDEISSIKATTSADFSGIVETAIKSVVTIKTSAGYQGSGFIISGDGYVVTNAHVLADDSGYLASSITVITYDQAKRDAEFIGYDGLFDVALLKIPGNYPTLELADSDKVQIGEKVIAIGNPLGLQFSVSEGIVSAVNREGTNEIGAYIQTDAALNPGNSGGPLINKEGKVIGINNFKTSGGESLGFALESNYIKGSINEIATENLNQSLI